MKYLYFLFTLFFSLTLSINSYCQNRTEHTNDTLGYRIIKTGNDFIIYSNLYGSPDFTNARIINNRVYFRIFIGETKNVNGTKYQLITIPSSSKPLYQGNKKIDRGKSDSSVIVIVSEADYNQLFWIESNIIEQYTIIEYYKYANDIFSGILTCPFKYRFKTGNAPESLIDGDLNISPFFGWKFRISASKPYFIAPFVFTGITSLNYNSANNFKIINSDELENCMGITYGFGISFKFNNISPGILLGFDHGIGNLGKGFYYSDKPWISFSLNYDFIKLKQSKNESQ